MFGPFMYNTHTLAGTLARTHAHAIEFLGRYSHSQMMRQLPSPSSVSPSVSFPFLVADSLRDTVDRFGFKDTVFRNGHRFNSILHDSVHIEGVISN